MPSGSTLTSRLSTRDEQHASNASSTILASLWVGRPAANFARRLMLPVSNDTLLRTVRRRAARPIEAATVIGIDDWAYKRGQRYGTLVCDLDRRQVVTLLPDRDNGTVEAWLSQQPEIDIIAHDRGGGYGEAAKRALPQAVQVADRWHLMENASAAFLEAVRKSMTPIRVAVGTGPINPERLTHAERLQYEGHVRREAATSAILALAQQGVPLSRSPGEPATAESSSETPFAA